MTNEIIILSIAAFTAGFVDAIVGGGGLIQTPATMLILPQYPIATLLGTTKIPAFTGTSIAAFQYAKRIQLQWKLIAIMGSIALVAALTGSYCVTKVSNQFMKHIIFGVLLLVAIYTFVKKDLGSVNKQPLNPQKEIIIGAISAIFIGFYDGFIGPGTGSFLVVLFISVLGFDFIKASAHAKCINLATNAGSIILFAKSGHILYLYALPMAICNITGAYFGARLAILKGNQFIRYVFLLVILGTIIRFGFDIFKH
jgi:uncharacterized protein